MVCDHAALYEMLGQCSSYCQGGMCRRWTTMERAYIATPDEPTRLRWLGPWNNGPTPFH